MKRVMLTAGVLGAALALGAGSFGQTAPATTAPGTMGARGGPGARGMRGRPPADRPMGRTDAEAVAGHEQLVKKAKEGRIDVYFVGDSITRRWGATDYPEFLAHWKKSFFGWNAGDFGWGGDTTQNILWRLENGELDGVNPKVIVVMAGTNNVGTRGGDDKDAENIAGGIKAILTKCQEKAPNATIILTAIFPRNDNMAANELIGKINEKIKAFGDGKKVRFLNVNDQLAGPDGKLNEGMTVPDKLHLAVKGYEVWAGGLKPLLTELLGPPADKDLAPAPTGVPKVQR